MPREAVHTAVTSEYVRKLIRIKARQLRMRPEFRGAESEELRQELTLHILQKAHLFDPARGAVNTFIATVVNTAAAMMCRDRKRLKRGADAAVQSLEERAHVGEDGEDVTFAETVQESDLRRRSGGEASDELARRLAAADFSDALSRLEPRARDVAKLLMGGAREAAVAAALGISRRQVRKAAEAIRERLDAAGLADPPAGGQGAGPTA